jgi:hypothetical protein
MSREKILSAVVFFGVCRKRKLTGDIEMYGDVRKCTENWRYRTAALSSFSCSGVKNFSHCNVPLPIRVSAVAIQSVQIRTNPYKK